MAESGDPPTLYEWVGGREAFDGLIDSQPGSDVPHEAPVPHWDWGEAPPYLT